MLGLAGSHEWHIATPLAYLLLLFGLKGKKQEDLGYCSLVCWLTGELIAAAIST